MGVFDRITNLGKGMWATRGSERTQADADLEAELAELRAKPRPATTTAPRPRPPVDDEPVEELPPRPETPDVSPDKPLKRTL